MLDNLIGPIEKGQIVLFLGAGASFGCITKDKTPVPMAGELAGKLASAANLPYEDESLDAVYQATREILGKRLDEILEKEFKHVQPSYEYLELARYVWRRIYTLNIDDGLDKALSKNSPQNINKFLSKDPIVEKDPFFADLEFVKLNGTAERLHEGVIFSASEYAKATASHLPWYSQCASDFVRMPMLFIGTQLNEPLLKFHIEKYKELSSESQGVSYVIAKSATPIQIAALKAYKIEFIQGTLTDFVKWLTVKIPNPSSPDVIAKINIPQLTKLMAPGQGYAYAKLFEKVTVVRRDTLPLNPPDKGTAIRDFYKGFRATWNDISEGIPAELDVLNIARTLIDGLDLKNSHRLLPLVGPAGSGKTTLMMQICWHFSNQQQWTVYYLDAQPEFLLDTLLALEQTSSTENMLVAFDNIEFSTQQLLHALSSLRLRKTLLIGTERESSWNRRGRNTLRGYYEQPLYVREFSDHDAKKLLAQLKSFGSWTRLGKLSEKERVKELVDRSKKQLLIALLEATLGRGFEQIIEREFENIVDSHERLFLITVAIITDRRCEAKAELVDRALEKMSVLRRSGEFSKNLAGIIHTHGDKLFARHPVYAKYLLERIVDPTLAAAAVNGLLQAFSDYKAPVIQSISRDEAVLYKSLINHTFLYEVLKGSETLVVKVYRELEKKFERDGLFWLQYGLALRDFGDHSGALEKLRIACEAYAMPHTLHALAQQLMLNAVDTESPALAMGLAEEAKGILEKLDDIIDSDDTYPIVTLAEGYTAVLRKHVSDIEARTFARKYSLVLQNRASKNVEHDRLRVSYERMFKYASTGAWIN